MLRSILLESRRNNFILHHSYRGDVPLDNGETCGEEEDCDSGTKILKNKDKDREKTLYSYFMRVKTNI